MSRGLAALLATVLALAACQEALPVGPAPVSAEASDALFVFVVRSPSDRHAALAPIEVFAEVVYQGNRNRVTISHAASPVGWQIVQLDGPAVMEGGMDMPCLQTGLVNGQVRRYDFEKAGVIEGPPFDRAWFEDPVLRLPAGRWRVTGTFSAALGECGGEHHGLDASIDLVVGG